MKRLFMGILAMTTLLLSSCGSNSYGWVKNKRHYTNYGIQGYWVYDVDYYQSWLVDENTTKWFINLDDTKYVVVSNPKEYINKLVFQNNKYAFYIYIEKVPQ